jgi:DNA-binding PadR family transcriptional regulator
MPKKDGPLPQVAFSILLALSLRPRHGYEIMKQVAEDSGGKIKLGPGTLYASIKQLHDNGLIQEVDTGATDSRRRQYQLTGNGRVRFEVELAYYEAALELGAQRRRSFEADLGRA